jgi:hypothetical protein
VTCGPICGGIYNCGGCPAGDTCSAGQCVVCHPDCSGASCGDPNGCGGTCSGACPRGFLCEATMGQGPHCVISRP